MLFSQFGILGIGTTELLVVLLIVLLLFGSRKLPELARSAGTSVRELRKGLSEGGNAKDQKQAKKDSQESAS
ncbi:MAG TPA: twin-arginine translocase TatA/TatE family subunit [Candidatus Saccharimonadales bacterium]|nr:twin-arginine translocase TatA/TatE family subunit [Candidatus Saccharimonadales bacterium]